MTPSVARALSARGAPWLPDHRLLSIRTSAIAPGTRQQVDPERARSDGTARYQCTVALLPASRVRRTLMALAQRAQPRSVRKTCQFLNMALDRVFVVSYGPGWHPHPHRNGPGPRGRDSTASEAMQASSTTAQYTLPLRLGCSVAAGDRSWSGAGRVNCRFTRSLAGRCLMLRPRPAAGHPLIPARRIGICTAP